MKLSVKVHFVLGLQIELFMDAELLFNKSLNCIYEF